ncbi:MAG: hypothetical protein J6R18_08620, partial [Kiritimatiellae bacterium]|nr:hypothetical protein [Kiritimatiellia bacterium]
RTSYSSTIVFIQNTKNGACEHSGIVKKTDFRQKHTIATGSPFAEKGKSPLSSKACHLFQS